MDPAVANRELVKAYGSEADPESVAGIVSDNGRGQMHYRVGRALGLAKIRSHSVETRCEAVPRVLRS